MQSSAFPIENFPTVLLHLQHQSLQSSVLGSIQTAWGWREIFVSLHQFRSPNTQRLKKKGVLVLSKAMIIRTRIFLKPDLFYPNRPSVQTKSVKLLIDAASFWNHSPEYVFVLYCFVLLLLFFLEPTDLRIRVDNWNQITSNSIEYTVSAWWNSYEMGLSEICCACESTCFRQCFDGFHITQSLSQFQMFHFPFLSKLYYFVSRTFFTIT